jgi:hypothetical protein
MAVQADLRGIQLFNGVVALSAAGSTPLALGLSGIVFCLDRRKMQRIVRGGRADSEHWNLIDWYNLKNQIIM